MKEIIKLRPFKKFCMTIGNLPSSYVESLTYAELLYWFCDFLQNNVIPAINNNAQAVQELQGLFTELQNYVNNYFENLDVQEEINNKLDEMADDGTLADIVSMYINASCIKYFSNVEDMKSADTLIIGNIVETKGYYNPNDGGNAKYIIREKNENDVEGNGLIHFLQNNLVAELVIENKKINVLQCGVKVNVDENQGILVQKLLDLPMKYILYFPSGHYYFTQPLVNNNRHDIIGVCNTTTDFDRQINGSRLYFTDMQDDDILLDCYNGSRCTIRDIYIINDNVSITLDKSRMSSGVEPVDMFTKTVKNNNIIGIRVGLYGNQLENVSVYGTNIGLSANTYNVFTNIAFMCCELGLQCFNDNVFTNVNVQRCENGMLIRGGLNNISNLRMDSIRYNGLEISTGANSNNITNFIADICQYASLVINNARYNSINGVIGRSGVYYANFAAEDVPNADKYKACKIYLKNSSMYNKIDIIAYKGNATDNNDNIKYISAFTIVTGGSSQANNSYNDIKVTGKVFDDNINITDILSIDNLKRLYSNIEGYISGTVVFEGITYFIKQTNNIIENNISIIKPIAYNENIAVLNTNGNLDMKGKKITNIDELLLGENTNGWLSMTRSSNLGNLKVQNVDDNYHRTDAQITGVATPTTNTSAVNKDYVDNL